MVGQGRVEAAGEFRNDYQVDYYPEQQDNGIKTRVDFRIDITNLRENIIVKRYSIGLPQSFAITNIDASDNNGSIIPDISYDDTNIIIRLAFNNPQAGIGTTNTFYLSFYQDNLFIDHEHIWEVILPIMKSEEDGEYNVNVHTSTYRDKKISIAKPEPTTIENSTISWHNPTTKVIYATFGTKQYYDVNLRYHLANPEIRPVYTDIALPPDTLYQKTYINSLSPQPEKTYLDIDDNLMARYYLNPKEEKNINYSSTIELFAIPRDEPQPHIETQLEEQKSHLLTKNKYWEVTNYETSLQSTTVENIYEHVVANYEYNYDRLNTNLRRLGAQYIYTNPDQAVCMEFTDLFIALTRDNGIYSRAISGYGITNDVRLRPLSLAGDVLHAWPEYFNTETRMWQPIDPTWENTSHIDYFSSFDFNHIAFAIHGQDPNSPLPAGMYKNEHNSKDITIVIATEHPQAQESLAINNIRMLPIINTRDVYSGSIHVRNTGNVYMWNVPITIASSHIDIGLPEQTITAIAPYEEYEVMFDLKASSDCCSKTFRTKLQASIGDEYQEITIYTIPWYADRVGKGIIITLTITLLILFLRKTDLHNKKKKQKSRA